MSRHKHEIPPTAEPAVEVKEPGVPEVPVIPKVGDPTVHDDSAANIRAHALYEHEVKTLHETVDALAKEAKEEGEKEHHTAEYAIAALRSKLKKFLGPWT